MSVVVVASPLRISLGGGGTDLPSFYEQWGGYVISATINKYVYFMAHPSFEGTWRLKYSDCEESHSPGGIRHRLFRECVKDWTGDPLEIATVADVPAGTGLGSSGAFTVGLLHTLNELRPSYNDGDFDPTWLAEQAFKIERGVLDEPVGKQDQYAAAFGGFIEQTYDRDGRVAVRRLDMHQDVWHQMNTNFLAFFTGKVRPSSILLSDQHQRTAQGEEAMIENLRRTMAMGMKTRILLEKGDLRGYAELMDAHWQNKKARSPEMTNSKIEQMYAVARSNGALGGKVVGAGGGGYLLVYTERHEETRAAMKEVGAPELEFTFSDDGVYRLDEHYRRKV